MPAYTTPSVMRARDGIVCTVTDDGAVLLDIRTGTLHGLDAAAAAIWAAVAGGVPAQDARDRAATALADRFALDAKRARDDGAAFVDALLALDFLECA
jgi:hypothetical protein